MPEAGVKGIGRFVEAACCRSESDDSRSAGWRLWRFMPSCAPLPPGPRNKLGPTSLGAFRSYLMITASARKDQSQLCHGSSGADLNPFSSLFGAYRVVNNVSGNQIGILIECDETI